MEFANFDIKKLFCIWIGSLCIFVCFSGSSQDTNTDTFPLQSGNTPPITQELPEYLDLQTAQKIALEQNPSLKAVSERIEQARQKVKQALSQYYPQIIANYTASHTELSDTAIRHSQNAVWQQSSNTISQSVLRSAGGTTGSDILSSIPWETVLNSWISAYQASNSIPESQNNYAINFIIRYTLFDGFARKYSVALAKLGEKATEESQQEAIRMLLSAVANSFYAVQLAEENLRIAEADKAFNERQLYEAKVKQELGAGSLSDVLNFEVLLRSAEAQIINARQNREIARISLAGVMGLNTGVLPDNVKLTPLKDETDKDLETPNVDELLSLALQSRPDLKMLTLIVQQTEAQVGQSRSTLFPQIGVSLSRSATRTVDSEFRSDDFATTVSVDVSYNLFTGGKNRALRAEARAKLREAEQNYYAGRIDVITDVQSTLQELKSAQEQLKLQRENAQYVRKNRDLVEQEYKAGQTSLVRLNQA
ncbi:MAG: TolC family protein, partial [Candidatus Hydrogenedens sp.]